VFYLWNNKNYFKIILTFIDLTLYQTLVMQASPYRHLILPQNIKFINILKEIIWNI